ncbi:hypothetical protein [Microbulbifer sp. A4B17]|nr:hypothetical protein [Microbulbifer sp. A4B17]
MHKSAAKIDLAQDFLCPGELKIRACNELSPVKNITGMSSLVAHN